METPTPPKIETPVDSQAQRNLQRPDSEKRGGLIDDIVSKAFPNEKAAVKEVPPAPKPEEKKDAPAAPAPTGDDEPPAEVKSESAKANWKTLRAKAKERDAFETQVKDLQKQMDELKKAPKTADNTAEWEALKKERDAYSERLRIVDIENHPKFKAYFGTQMDNQVNLAKQIVGTEVADKIAGLLKLPESEYKQAQLDELVANLPPLKQARLGAVLNDIDRINMERSAEIAKANEQYKNIMAQQEQQTKAEQAARKSQSEAAFKSSLDDAMKSLPVFQKRDGDEAWNKSVDTITANAQAIFNGELDLPNMAKAAIWSAAAPALLQNSMAIMQERDQLKAELAALKKATPNPGSDPVIPKDDLPATASVIDRITMAARQSGALSR